ncbi:UNKNOWN [Stylonychia lemnae]|uniref:LITAF domain-containing protein n=1 Tax=Stylonychia lemnae TaxID=5949 RepID=A0A078B5W1_STYLE|nr:UNKNOWN [Stylonychia lemnae]|eukprot:CDW89616.1 UNKNOWN [Stylonychia lemnae]
MHQNQQQQQLPYMNIQMGPQVGYQTYQQPQQMYINNPQGYMPAYYQCYHCGENINTIVTREVTQTQYLWCMVGVLVFLPLGIIPFYVDDCYKYHHHCPKCRGKIGSSQND